MERVFFRGSLAVALFFLGLGIQKARGEDSSHDGKTGEALGGAAGGATFLGTAAAAYQNADLLIKKGSAMVDQVKAGASKASAAIDQLSQGAEKLQKGTQDAYKATQDVVSKVNAFKEKFFPSKTPTPETTPEPNVTPSEGEEALSKAAPVEKEVPEQEAVKDTEAAADKTEAVADKTEAVADKTEAVADKTEAVADKTKTLGEDVATAPLGDASSGGEQAAKSLYQMGTDSLKAVGEQTTNFLKGASSSLSQLQAQLSTATKSLWNAQQAATQATDQANSSNNDLKAAKAGAEEAKSTATTAQEATKMTEEGQGVADGSADLEDAGKAAEIVGDI